LNSLGIWLQCEEQIQRVTSEKYCKVTFQVKLICDIYYYQISINFIYRNITNNILVQFGSIKF